MIRETGPGLQYRTIADALKSAVDGDEIVVAPGTYTDKLIINKAVQIRSAVPQAAVVSGGYSDTWARRSGSSWRDVVYRSPTSAMATPVQVRHDDVEIIGLSVVDSGQDGISVGAWRNVTIQGCRVRHVYNTSILVNGGAAGDATNIYLLDNECNIASVKRYDPNRGQDGGPQAVSGIIKVTGKDIVVSGNVCSRGGGEGINIGKNVYRVLVEGNIVYDSAHIGIYVNRGQDITVVGNTVFFTGDPAYLWTDNEAPCAIGLRDEEVTRAGVWILSRNVEIRDNLTVNAGFGLLVNPERPTTGIVVSGNKFIGGPLTRKGLTFDRAAGTVFAENHILAPADLLVDGSPAGVSFSDNWWSSEPPLAWQGEGDTYGVIPLVAPHIIPGGDHEKYGLGEGYSIDLANYRLPPVVDPPPDPEPEPPAPDAVELRRMARQLRQATRSVDEAMSQLETYLSEFNGNVE